MTSLQILLGTIGVLGLIFMMLTVNVQRQRITTNTHLGDGSGGTGTEALLVAVRSHANFAEYVPLSLLLIGGIAYAGVNRYLMLGLCVALVAGRIMHPFGMRLPAPNPLRAGGIILNWVVILIASFTAIIMAA